MSLASHASERAAAELDYDNHPDDEGNYLAEQVARLTEENTEEGWAFPHNCRKAHYFVNGRSLCGRWGYLAGGLEPYGESSRDDCKTCTRKVNERRRKAGLFSINVMGAPVLFDATAV